MADSILGNLLTSAPPNLTDLELQSLAKEHYGVSGTVHRLSSERDLNVKIVTPSESFVLKVSNLAEPQELTDLQTKAMLYLESSGLPVPSIVRTRSGSTGVPLPQGMLRMITFLKGTPQHLAPRTPGQARAVAAIAARLSLGLKGFVHGADQHVLQWDIKQAGSLRSLLSSISDSELRRLATQTLDDFDREIAPRLVGLRWQWVHNDLNPHNLLVDPQNPDTITGVLDFGDMVHTPLICDAAVAASYHINPEDALGSLQNFLGAYHEVLPVTLLEAQLFPSLVATRMLTTLAITSKRAAKYPGNAAYILRNFPASSEGLVALSKLDPKTVRAAMEALL